MASKKVAQDEISLGFEGFLMSILGATCCNVHSRCPTTGYRLNRIYRRVINALERAVDWNVTSDGFHEFRIKRRLSLLKRQRADSERAWMFAALAFELLGGVPEYRGQKVVNRPSNYRLDKCRTVRYCQTDEQRARTILEASKWEPFSQIHSHESLFMKFPVQYRRNPRGFMKWYRREYPQAYGMLFLGEPIPSVSEKA